MLEEFHEETVQFSCSETRAEQTAKFQAFRKVKKLEEAGLEMLTGGRRKAQGRLENFRWKT
jgi:hypothetical protein